MPMARESDLTLPACCRGEKVEVGARGGGGVVPSHLWVCFD